MKKLTSKVLNNNVYSIDMVRLRIRIESSDVKSFFDKYSCNSDVSYYETTQFTKYKHNWLFTTMDYESFNKSSKGVSFWVGYQFGSEQKSNKHWLVIEYNPNKNDITRGYLNDILLRFFNCSALVEIVSVDIACDMPINIKTVYCDKGGKQLKKVFDYGGDNRTIYLGQGNGRIKIYNKAREMGLEGVELTRYEISISNFEHLPVSMSDVDISACINLVPIYCIDSYQFDMALNGTDKALVYAVLNGYPLEDLPRDKRGKIKKILSDSAGNTLESEGFANAFKKYFIYHKTIIH